MPSPQRPAPPTENPSGVLRGMGFMLVSTICYGSMSAVVHGLDDVHPAIVAFFRSLFGLLATLPIFLRYGVGVLRTEKLGLHALRGFFAVTSMYTFFTALSMSELAKVTALHFTTPVFAALLSILILRERIRLHRAMALVAGFAGALIVMRPGIAAFDLGAVLVLVTAFLWGMGLVTTKVLARTERSITVVVYMGIFLTPITLVPAIAVWETPDMTQLGLLVVVGLLGTVSHTCIAQAFREADATAVLPIDFFRLIWASLLGYLVFAEVPDVWTWIGGVAIFGAGTFIAYREERARRGSAPVPRIAD